MIVTEAKFKPLHQVSVWCYQHRFWLAQTEEWVVCQGMHQSDIPHRLLPLDLEKFVLLITHRLLTLKRIRKI